jgi:uncharacterized protein
MDATLSQAQTRIAQLCASQGVRSLDAFGSATQITTQKTPNDYDFIVELEPQVGSSKARRWIALAEGLEALLGKPVDLVSASSVRNPHFAQSVAATRLPIYARTGT